MKASNHSGRLTKVSRFALVLLFCGLTLFCALEITARLYYFGWKGLDLRRVPITRGLTPPNLYAGDTGFVPNLDVFSNLVHFRTNSRGLRDKEYELRKPRGTFRVAVLGSSFAMPSGVEIEHAFHSLLEDRLSLEHSPVRYEFINFAKDASGAISVLNRLRKDVRRYRPDLILVTLTAAVVPYYLLEWRKSEAELDRMYRWPPPGLLKSVKNDPLFRFYLVKIYNKFMALRRVNARTDTPLFMPPSQMEPPPVGPRPDDVVRKLGALSRKGRIPIVLIRLEYDHGIPRTPADDRLAARVADEGMYYLNTLEAFHDTVPRDFWVHGLDRHPNASAQAVFADVLEKFLEGNDLLGLNR